MREGPLKVFIHVAKCGGTTVDANLRAHLGARYFLCERLTDRPTLYAHVENGFRDIDAMMVHDGRFPYEEALSAVEVEYYAVCREPVSAAVSMFNFATTADHTRNYKRVKDLDFWQFMAFCHKIHFWAPNFQCYYLAGSRSWDEVSDFIERHRVRLFPLWNLDGAYRAMMGRGLDPALDQNISPKKQRVADLDAIERRVLGALFEADQALWEAVQAQQ